MIPNMIKDLLSNVSPDDVFPLIIVSIGCMTAIVITIGIAITSTINAIHRRNATNRLKREMLELGLSSQEIEQVVQAAPPLEDAEELKAAK